MKSFAAAVAVLASLLSLGSAANPLGIVLSLLDELQAKIVKEGEAEVKAFKEFFEWCDDTSKNGDFAIKTAKAQKGKLEAKIGELTSEVDTSSGKIEELAAAVAQGEAELKDAAVIRKKEESEFQSSEAELMEAIDTLGRAIAVLEREMAKNPAALAQVQVRGKDISGAFQALSAILDAAAFSGTDQNKLAALVQQQQTDEADDADFGAPAAATYKTHSGGILDVLEDLKEKAEGQLADLRKAEVNTRHNYEMLAQSLNEQAAADSKDMDDEKASKAAAEEAKATAEGDLQTTLKDLEASEKALAHAHASCMQTAADHEATVAARDEELKVIAEAKKILQETSSGAVSQSYSLLELSTGSRLRSRADLARSEVIALIKRLARKSHSAALAQLASRIAAVTRYGAAAGEDPFGKVKGLIQDMIAKLESEAAAETTEKAYCDEQMAKTAAKKSELEDDVAKMTSKVDQAAARSAQLKEEIAELQSELSALAKQQAEMDKIRQEAHEDYVTAKADLELGLTGVRKALQVLREYYASGSAALMQQGELSSLMQQPAVPEKHSKATGAGQSIIGILEVVESDFAKNLAKEESEEDDSQDEYEKMTQENKVTKTLKDQDVKYKTQESKQLDKTAAEMSSDRETTNTELSAMLEYYAKIKDRCIAKPETYETRKARREAEIQGLKEALRTLEDETAFVQRKRRGGLRGSIQA